MKRVVMWSTVLLLCLVLLSGCGKKNDEGSSSNVSEGSGSSLSSAIVSEAPVMVKVAVVKNASSGLNVRPTASSEGEKLAVVNNGDTFRLMADEPDGDWYKISYNGSAAYLNQEYVEIKEITEDEISAIESSAAASNSSSASDNSTSSSSDNSTSSSSSDSSASNSESSDSSNSESSDTEVNTPDEQDVEN